METEGKTEKGMGADAPRFHNRLYRAEVDRTPAGSPVIGISPTNPRGRYGRPRQITAVVYEVAAELERRSDELDARWVVSPNAAGARIVIELVGHEGETARADEFIAGALADLNLA
jgi:hypothetical protein